MKGLKNYDNFFLPAEDMDKSMEFYSETLGLPLKFNFLDKGMVAYKVGAQEPAIILKDRRKFPDAKPAIWFVVENVRESYAELSDKGVVFMSEPFRIGTGWAAEFEDPSGNRLGITDYIKD